MKKIIYTRPDGGLSVVTPVRNTIGETLKTDEEIEQRAFDRLPQDAINPKFVDVVPTDRTFRNAWEDNNGVNVNMLKARELHKNKLRFLRAPKLAALDVESIKALESGDTVKQAQIVAQKQALRDVTQDPAISSAQTPEQLKNVIPEVLR